MKKIICFFKGHKRGKTECYQTYNGMVNGKFMWKIECSRCGYRIDYQSHMARLIGIELRYGFDGK